MKKKAPDLLAVLGAIAMTVFAIGLFGQGSAVTGGGGGTNPTDGQMLSSSSTNGLLNSGDTNIFINGTTSSNTFLLKNGDTGTGVHSLSNVIVRSTMTVTGDVSHLATVTVTGAQTNLAAVVVKGTSFIVTNAATGVIAAFRGAANPAVTVDNNSGQRWGAQTTGARGNELEIINVNSGGTPLVISTNGDVAVNIQSPAAANGKFQVSGTVNLGTNIAAWAQIKTTPPSFFQVFTNGNYRLRVCASVRLACPTVNDRAVVGLITFNTAGTQTNGFQWNNYITSAVSGASTNDMHCAAFVEPSYIYYWTNKFSGGGTAQILTNSPDFGTSVNLYSENAE